MPVAIFASLYEKVQGWVRDDLPVLVTAMVRESGGAMELTVQDITPLEGIRERRARELAIRVNLAFADENVLARLQERLRSHPGTTPVSIRLDPPRRVRGHAQGRGFDADRPLRPADERDPGPGGGGVRRVRLLASARRGGFPLACGRRSPRPRGSPGDRGLGLYLAGGAVRDLAPRAPGARRRPRRRGRRDRRSRGNSRPGSRRRCAGTSASEPPRSRSPTARSSTSRPRAAKPTPTRGRSRPSPPAPDRGRPRQAGLHDQRHGARPPAAAQADRPVRRSGRSCARARARAPCGLPHRRSDAWIPRGALRESTGLSDPPGNAPGNLRSPGAARSRPCFRGPRAPGDPPALRRAAARPGDGTARRARPRTGHRHGARGGPPGGGPDGPRRGARPRARGRDDLALLPSCVDVADGRSRSRAHRRSPRARRRRGADPAALARTARRLSIAEVASGTTNDEVAAAAAALPAARRRALLERAASGAVRLGIRGADLLAAGVAAGPAVGAALARTLAARREGRIGKKDELAFALAHARRPR